MSLGKKELQGKRVLVFGSGISGIGAAKLLEAAEAQVVLYDGNEKLEIEAVRGKLPEASSCEIILGELTDQVISTLDLAVMSPGVPLDIPPVERMQAAGVPVIPGTKEPVFDWETGLSEADRIGFPVMIKAALGGGGKGMRMAETRGEFQSAFQTAQKEAKSSFADGTMYVERLIRHPRHVEFQIMADSFGNVIHLGERDCSIQRNHQKMIEESPSVVIDEELRSRMGQAAVQAAKAAGYTNAGTIEFLLERDGQFYFMEMNTRIQVEHPVTEWVTGVDLIQEQLRVASGMPLSVTQGEVRLSGHAIECRINAENPAKNFRPCPGKITEMHLPGGFGVRVDTAAYDGYVIPAFYDSMLAKLIVHGRTREEAIARMRSALGEVVIEGVDTNVDYLYSILNEEEYLAGRADIEFVERLTERL